MGRERFELSTFRLSAERSNHAELPALHVKYYRINILVLRIFGTFLIVLLIICFGAPSPVRIKALVLGACALSDVNWKQFEELLGKRQRPQTVADTVSYAKQYGTVS